MRAPLAWSLALRHAAVIAAALSVVLGGCTERQEIIEQTVRAKGETAAARIESRYVPEEFLTWEMVTQIDPGFESATAVAFDEEGGLYVAGDLAIRKYHLEGQLAWEMPIEVEPTSLATAGGNICVGTQQRVLIYGPDGTLATEIVPGGARTWITSVALSPEAIYVADAGNRRFLVYDIGGEPRGEIAAMDRDRDIPALSVPSPHLDVAIDSAGNILLTNPGRRSVQVHSPTDGALLSSFGRSGNDLASFSGCCNPTNIAPLADGRVLTSEKGIPRVKVMSAAGELLSVVVPPEDFAPMTAGIDLSADPWGRVAVLDPVSGIVRVYQESYVHENEESYSLDEVGDE